MTESQNSIVQSFERMKKEAYEDTLQYLRSVEQNSGIRFHAVAEDVRSQNQFYVFYPLRVSSASETQRWLLHV